MRRIAGAITRGPHVPEFEPRPPLVPPFMPSARTDSDADTDFEMMTAPLEEELRLQREGLPPGYRMRTEAHYVDQLVARAPVPQVRAVPIGDIDCLRPVDTATLEPLVRSIADRTIIMRDGRVIEHDTTDELLDHPKDEYTRRLLSDTPRPLVAADPGQRA